MYTILQDSSNKIQLPFKGNYDFILIRFTNRNKAVTAVFENLAGLGCDYDINIVEVGSDGVVDLNNGEIKLSPRATWKAKIYGQSDNVNLALMNATYLYDYYFQVKGDSCTVYPTDVKTCLDATAIVRTVSGEELAREDIAAGATETIVVPDYDVDVLHTYPYHLLNTGQVDSFAIGDDPWVRENVFEPEMATWPTDRPWVYPTLVDFFTLKDNNIFGNKNRFTDDLGLQDYVNGIKIDHHIGSMFPIKKYFDDLSIDLPRAQEWFDAVIGCNSFSALSKSDWFLPNVELLLSVAQKASAARFFGSTIGLGGGPDNSLWASTVQMSNTGNRWNTINGQALSNYTTTAPFPRPYIPFRKAFTYDPITEKMILA